MGLGLNVTRVAAPGEYFERVKGRLPLTRCVLRPAAQTMAAASRAGRCRLRSILAAASRARCSAGCSQRLDRSPARLSRGIPFQCGHVRGCAAAPHFTTGSRAALTVRLPTRPPAEPGNECLTTLTALPGSINSTKLCIALTSLDVECAGQRCSTMINCARYARLQRR
jgi:hypothetical protein